jgi:arylsulfatase A-like enzyme|tara:strand:- start:4059 stop:5495 length:1437 start_codon:yes stop_codon:yes gene_type:complete
MKISRLFIIFFNLFLIGCFQKEMIQRPNIILIMTDDQGWGQTGYYNHPLLKTPNLDEMANNGLRFDRFYAGAPVCSPTRASVLTGRSNDRTGVYNHGYRLRLQEKTISQALKNNGYLTAHFGKWHLNGLRGPGAPILKDDKYGPQNFGFDHWLSVTNFFDINPLMSENGDFIDFNGNSSEIIFNEALSFIKEKNNKEMPFFIVIWDGSPHSPFIADDEDNIDFKNLDERSKNHYGELVAFDNSLGDFRKGLQDLGISNNTILWFNSDNGGLGKKQNISPSTVGGLKGQKGDIWEGGIRVPSVIEWPSVIKSRISTYPSSTMDIFPTIVDILNLPDSTMLMPLDGESLFPLFNSKLGKRKNKIPFRYLDKGALIDNNFKLVVTSIKKNNFELYDLLNDPKESLNISSSYPIVFQEMKDEFIEWNKSVNESINGNDYNEEFINEDGTEWWPSDERYKPFLNDLIKRPEYTEYIKRRANLN